MLMKSEFNCIGRKNGYYADEGLECEIFHYCADGVMHSWLCPEGASFHQVNFISFQSFTSQNLHFFYFFLYFVQICIVYKFVLCTNLYFVQMK